MNIHSNIARAIINAQTSVIGPIAVEQAKSVKGISFSNINDIKLKGNGKSILEELVSVYSNFFGQASVEVCKDAIREMNPPVPLEDLPDNLR